MKTIFELSVPGRKTDRLMPCDVPERPIKDLLPGVPLRESLDLPEVSELDVVRHFTNLSQQNFSIDTHFYPLGSCTMKYNPKVHEVIAGYSGFSRIHPCQAESTVQGALELLYTLRLSLAEISGMGEVTLQPVAGAHGEFTSLLMIRAYHESRGDDGRKIVLVPQSAHGTNPASAARCGYDVVEIPTNSFGLTDVTALNTAMTDEVAALMLTNPNTLGLFETGIDEIERIVHDRGGLLYCDGANLNAIMGVARPGDMGFDVMHFNLHKTFATPHGGGGPGAGAVGVKAILRPFLPMPQVVFDNGCYSLDYSRPQSIGRVHAFYGNFGNAVRCAAYLRGLGPTGVRSVAENAVLNANYLLWLLKDDYDTPYSERCMHEFVLSGERQRQHGVRTLDIAKRLLDLGFHAPTVYFPLMVRECMMVEPTETESKEMMELFATALKQIAREVETDPQRVLDAPTTMPVGRLDETKAARFPDLSWKDNNELSA